MAVVFCELTPARADLARKFRQGVASASLLAERRIVESPFVTPERGATGQTRLVASKVVVVMEHQIPSGTERVIDGRLRVYYDGYWILAYEVPADTLLAKNFASRAVAGRFRWEMFNFSKRPACRAAQSTAVGVTIPRDSR